MTGWGWETNTFSLRLGELEGVEFEIVETSEYSGDDSLLASNDAEEVADWIAEQIRERDE